jgi:hypothetical protein
MIPVLKEARAELTLERRTLGIWMLVAYNADVFILGQNILRAYDACVDLGRHMFRLSRDVVPVNEAPTASVLKRSRPAESLRNSQSVSRQ